MPPIHSTVNTGSYFKTLFSGKTVAISFDVSEMVNPVSRLGPVVCSRLASYHPAPLPQVSEIYWQIDNGPMTMALVAPLISLTVPTPLTQGDVPYHLLTVLVKVGLSSCTE